MRQALIHFVFISLLLAGLVPAQANPMDPLLAMAETFLKSPDSGVWASRVTVSRTPPPPLTPPAAC